MTGPVGVSDFGITGGDPAGPDRPDAGWGSGAEAQFELAAVTRRLISAVVAADVPEDDVRAATASVTATVEALEGASRGHRPRGRPDPAGAAQEFFPTSPVIGFANPVAPPVEVEFVDGELRGNAFFDHPYEGPPTCVHGGVIALVFDELLGAVNIASGSPAMTGTLTIRYRKPTPLRTPLRLVARTVGREGRKVRAWGGIYHGEVLTAEAEGIFIEVIPENLLRVIAANAEGSGSAADLRVDLRRLGLDPPPA